MNRKETRLRIIESKDGVPGRQDVRALEREKLLKEAESELRAERKARGNALTKGKEAGSRRTRW